MGTRFLLLSLVLGSCATSRADIFEQDAWLLGAADPWQSREGVAGIRRPMVEHLVASGELTGKTFSELSAMLGPQDPMAAECPGFGKRWWDSVWGLGPGESTYLLIRYGDDQRVAECRLVDMGWPTRALPNYTQQPTDRAITQPRDQATPRAARG